MTEFRKISDIDLAKPETWQNAAFLTFDIDWAHDDVLSHTIDIVEEQNILATWFVTHETRLLDRLRENPKFELGIHPNFNFLLSGADSPHKTAEAIVDAILEIVPEARCVRSHSMTQSTNLMGLFAEKGLSYDCNHFIPHQSGITLAPWKTWNGLIKVPYFWEDDVACIYEDKTNISSLKQANGLKVFDFHPIHIFLNTEHMDRYEQSRSVHRAPKELLSHVNKKSDGARTKLQRLMEQK